MPRRDVLGSCCGDREQRCEDDNHLQRHLLFPRQISAGFGMSWWISSAQGSLGGGVWIKGRGLRVLGGAVVVVDGQVVSVMTSVDIVVVGQHVVIHLWA